MSFLFGFITGVIVMGVAAAGILYFRHLPRDPDRPYRPATPASVYLP